MNTAQVTLVARMSSASAASSASAGPGSPSLVRRVRVLDDLSNPGVRRVVEAAARKGVALDIRFIPVSTGTPEEIAAALDAELGQIVETLAYVAPQPGGRLATVICLVSGRNHVDTRSLSAVTGEANIRRATAREASDLAGSIGVLPPFGYGRDVRIVMDQDLARHQWVWAAAGVNTGVFRVAPRTLQVLSNAVVAPVAAAL